MTETMTEDRRRLMNALSDIERDGTSGDAWVRLAAYSYELADWDGDRYRLTKAGGIVLDSLRGDTHADQR